MFALGAIKLFATLETAERHAINVCKTAQYFVGSALTSVGNAGLGFAKDASANAIL